MELNKKATVVKETKPAKETKANEKKPVDVAAEIDSLLKTLAGEEDKMEKRRLRRNLRSLGHRGGLKNTKFAKSPVVESKKPQPQPQTSAAASESGSRAVRVSKGKLVLPGKK